MGLLQVGAGAAESVLADQWREYFYCDALPEDVLMKKGEARQARRAFNTKKSDNLISNGAIIAVNEGQCMIIVDNGAIVEVCAEPGKFLFDSSTEPKIFYGGLKKGIVDSFHTWKKRVGFGGDTATDQRIYFFNTKDIIGNKYGTQNPIPFRIVDQNIGLDTDVAIRCHGEYAYRLADPILFYKKLCGNVSDEFRKDRLDSQLKSELLTALQPAFAAISAQGVRYSQLPAHADDIAKCLDTELSRTWGQNYGIEIAAFGLSSATISDEDAERIKQLQMNATLKDPTLAAATLAAAQAQAMKDAAKNTSTGPMMAFAGMNMAGTTGGLNAQQLYAMGAQQSAAPAAPKVQPAVQNGSWTCSCGTVNTGNFCSNCGSRRPQPASWTCPQCGQQENHGNFCSNCGAPRP